MGSHTLNITLENEQQIASLFSILDEKMGRNSLLSGMKKSANPMKSEMQKNIPVSKEPFKIYYKGRLREIIQPGTAKKSIKIRGLKKSKFPTILIGPAKGKNEKYDAWFQHFTEFGTARGIKATHWASKSYDTTKEKVLDNMQKYIFSEIDKAVTKSYTAK